MKVSHFSTSLKGGAGIAADRLHRSLLEREVSSRLIYGGSSLSAPSAICHPVADKPLFRLKDELRHGILRRALVSPSTKFTSPYGVRKTPLDVFGPLPEIVNLHWVSKWLDIPSFLESVPDSVPVVWSLHDLNPATAGCHLPGDCRQFESACNTCPLFKKPWQNIVAKHYWKSLIESYNRVHLHVVGNSSWTTAQAQKSALFENADSFTTIPLGLDLREYTSLPKELARDALNFRPDGIVLGFACADLSDTNKNIHTLLRILKKLSARFPITLLTMGDGQLPEMPPSLHHIHVGSLGTPAMQSVFYSALDVFVMPSMIETFGLTALESLACGTPVVAYRTGGLPDFVIDGNTGWLAPDPSDPAGLYLCLEHCMRNPRMTAEAGRKTRRYVELHHDIGSMTRSYISLYQQITKTY